MENVNEPKTISVKFNKRDIRLDGERLKKLAQMGLKYEQILPLLDNIKSVAAREGMSFKDFSDKLCKEKNDEYYNGILKKVGGDKALADELMKSIDGKAASKAQSDEPKIRTVDNLIEEFDGISGEFEGIKSFDDVNDEIINEALQKNIPLYDAVLRYCHRQQKMQRQELDNQQLNKKAALNIDNDTDSVSESEILAMLKGIGNK